MIGLTGGVRGPLPILNEIPSLQVSLVVHMASTDRGQNLSLRSIPFILLPCPSGLQELHTSDSSRSATLTLVAYFAARFDICQVSLPWVLLLPQSFSCSGFTFVKIMPLVLLA